MATITERISQFLNDVLENRQLEKAQKMQVQFKACETLQKPYKG